MDQMIAVFGQRESGKSTWILKNLGSFEPFILVDPLYDPKFVNADVYQLLTVQQGFDVFKRGMAKRIYITPNLRIFNLFCGIVLATGNITLIVDEVDTYSTTHVMPRNFEKIIKIGRHNNVNVIAVSRRPKEMNLLIRSQAKRFIIFPMGGEDARDLAEYIGSCWTHIIDLKRGEYIDYDFKERSMSIHQMDYTIDKSTPEER